MDDVEDLSVAREAAGADHGITYFGHFEVGG